MNKDIIKFYPLGNADTSLITLSDGRHILWDYANMKDSNDDEDLRCDLPDELNKDVKGDFDVVTFTHADRDHINKFSEYFYLEHAAKYQKNGRKKILEMWVPATVLIDTQAEDEAKILKAEARHRLKSKKGILVFSSPNKIKKWCDEQDDISYAEVKHLFVDAGKLVPGFTKENDGVEFFVHAPFMSESQKLDRNGSAIVVQACFNDRCNSKLILGSDCTHEVWQDIVKITKHKMNNERLTWDLFHISHHCSYLSLSDEKGVDKTVPLEEIKWLYEEQGNTRGRMISSSKSIPKKRTDEDADNNPPHRQAAEYYKSVAKKNSGEFIVTMEHPNIEAPEPLVVTVDKINCTSIQKKTRSAAAFIGGSTVPRAGME